MSSWRPQPLIRVTEPFDAGDWIFELKHDRFRAFAIVSGHRCTLVSRRGHVFNQWPQLAEELAHTVKAEHAVLDGEIVCLEPDGASDFHNLLFRRDWPFFFAFDLLTVDGEDLRVRPLIERKRVLRHLMPRYNSRLRFVDHVRERGRDLFELACAHDTSGWNRRHFPGWIRTLRSMVTHAGAPGPRPLAHAGSPGLDRGPAPQ